MAAKPAVQVVQVVRVEDAAAPRWNAFVDECAASFYHRYEWRGVNREAFGHRTCYLAAIAGEQIVGIFPLVQVKSLLFGNIACSLPFVNYGGPVTLSPDAEELLLVEAERVAAEWGVAYLEIRTRKHLGERFPTADHKVSMTIQLEPDPEVLWNRFKTGHRQDIRKGYKNGLTAKIGAGELLGDFYTVLSESWRDLGTPVYRKSYLERIIDTFPGSTRLTVVYAGDEPAAAAFDGIQGDTIEGMWMGTRAEFRSKLAGYVLYWENIKDGCERGLKRFHLGRSTVQSGGESFKKKWNAEPLQLYWQYVLRNNSTIPALNVDNPKYRLAISAWRKLPLQVTELVGPFIARSIP